MMRWDEILQIGLKTTRTVVWCAYHTALCGPNPHSNNSGHKFWIWVQGNLNNSCYFCHRGAEATTMFNLKPLNLINYIGWYFYQVDKHSATVKKQNRHRRYLESCEENQDGKWICLRILCQWLWCNAPMPINWHTGCHTNQATLGHRGSCLNLAGLLHCVNWFLNTFEEDDWKLLSVHNRST